MNIKRVVAGVLPFAIVSVGLTLTGSLPFLPDRFSVASARTAAASYSGKMPIVNTPGYALGAYDPHGDFKNLAGDRIEHIFLPWQDVDLASLSDADAYAQARRRDLLITVEPWSWSKDWRLTSNQLQTAIFSGEYDKNIDAVCRALGSFKSSVTIRWGQETDDRSGQFTWAGWEPREYIAAYTKFVKQCRSLAPVAKFMWSPKGENDMNDYYPGDQYVDVIGLSVFGLQQFDRDKFGHDRTFAEILGPGYKLASIHNKPIVVAELGYSGDASYVQQWANSVTKPNPAFPKLVSVIYFNDKEVFPWPTPYGLPDWRVVQPEVLN